MKFYVYLEPEAGALDTSLVALYYNPLGFRQWQGELPKLKSLGELEEITKELEEAETKGDLVYTHEYIPPLEINTLGRDKACSPYIETVIPELILKMKKQPESIYRLKDCPPSYYYPVQVINQEEGKLAFFLAQVISLAKRQWMIKYLAHPQNPQFEWDQNLGFSTRGHMRLCLEHGINCSLHYKSFLAQLPYFYLEEIKKFNPDFYFYPYFGRKGPVWWTRYFHDSFFTDVYDEQEREFYDCVFMDARIMADHLSLKYRLGHNMLNFYPPLY